MNPNSIQVLPYAPLSNNALIGIAIIAITIAVTIGLLLNHKHKMKKAEHEHLEAMEDIKNDTKSKT